MLAYHAVRARQVEDQFRTLYSQLGRWRHWAPQVFADLYAERVVTRQEQQINAERHVALPQFDSRYTRMNAVGQLLDGLPAGGKPAFLVELAGVRQVRFRHNTYHLAVGDHKRTVVQIVVRLERCANENDNRLAARELAHILQCRHGFLLQCVGEEQVGTGVACQSEFGEADYLHSFADCFGDKLFGLLRIERAIAYAQNGHCCRHTHKSEIRIHSEIILLIDDCCLRPCTAMQARAHIFSVQRYKKNCTFANLPAEKCTQR